MKKKNLFRGFTLVELLMVVAIIGILATIAIPQYTSYVEKAKISEAKTNLSAIRTALGIYYIENDAYTSNLSSLGVTISPNGFFNYTIVASQSGQFPSLIARRDGGSYDDATITMQIDGQLVYSQEYQRLR